jgi:3-phenylpropionate/trans-cinnamate dioxygenase ferredoxin reductase component
MVIVGAGECGVRAALALRERGYDGPVTLIGAERHAPYERPPMSKELMLAADDQAPRTIATPERLAETDILFHASAVVRSIDRERRTVVLGDDRSIGYDRLLLATGAQPRRLAAADGANIAYLRTHEDALRIRASLHRRERVVIVGGGFIGLELAAAARCVGAEVTVIEALPRLLSRGVPEDIAQALEARHRAEGVSILLNAKIASFAGDRVELADGTVILADLIIIGIGALPETSLAVAAGLTVDNGIAVDNRLRTSDPNIFAGGDCCSFPLDIYDGRRVRLESWRNAQEQGNLAARNMLGAEEPIAAVPWFWSDQYDLVLRIAGLPDEGHVAIRRTTDTATIVFYMRDDGRLVAAAGLGVGNAVARDIRIAELLIARRAVPDPAILANPEGKLKALL